jgi:Ni/Co efflux regulator RcnB
MLRNFFMKTAFVASLIFTIAAPAVYTQVLAEEHERDRDRDNHQYVRHEEWKKGAKMRDEDWKRGEHVDYHASHLRAPPRGYEWRQVDGNYVLAAVATGVIASVVTAAIVGR